jgi:polyisoprenoid-binding protein YceI
MKHAISVLSAFSAFFMLAGFVVLTADWNIDPNYSIRFSGKKAEGTFSGLRGKIAYDPADPASASIDVTVDATTIRTGNSLKDKHANGDTWFNTAKYPTIRFVSKSFTKAGNRMMMSGTLDLHGTRRDVKIPFTYSETNGGATFAGTFSLNRKDYGINGNWLGFTVGEAFTVELRVPVRKP